MASSVFLGPLGLSNTGSALVASLPLTFAASAGAAADAGISRTGAGALAFGNGTAGDATGTLAAANVNLTGNYRAGGGGYFFFNGSTNIHDIINGQLNITNAAETAGVGFDVLTDGVCKVRTRAQTGYATIDCLGLKSSGNAGASFGPAGVISITVVNGIVTAIS